MVAEPRCPIDASRPGRRASSRPELVQRVDHVVAVLEALSGILGETAVDDVGQGARRERRDGVQRRRRLGDVRDEDGRRELGVERETARQREVADDAERIDVAARVDRVA